MVGITRNDMYLFNNTWWVGDEQIQCIHQPSRGMDHMSQGEFIEEFEEILMLTLTSTALFDTCVLTLDVGIVKISPNYDGIVGVLAMHSSDGV